MNIAKQIARLTTRLNRLETRQQKNLLKLPKKLGYDSVESLIEALQGASGMNGTTLKATKKAGRKARAVITDKMRETLKVLVGRDWKSKEIAEKLGIAVPTVQNIKKQLGLVGVRGGKRFAGRKVTGKATPDQIEAIERLTKEGKKMGEIAKEVGLGYSTVGAYRTKLKKK